MHSVGRLGRKIHEGSREVFDGDGGGVDSVTNPRPSGAASGLASVVCRNPPDTRFTRMNPLRPELLSEISGETHKRRLGRGVVVIRYQHRIVKEVLSPIMGEKRKINGV